jgi:hypothetical protein
MFAVIIVIAITALMLVVGVRGRNYQRINEGRPTIFQELMYDVRKDATPLPHDIDHINEAQARQCSLEITTFVVRFVCRDAALTLLTHPVYSALRTKLSTIIEDALLAADIIDIDDIIREQQQVKTCQLILSNTSICDELLKYCLNNPKVICGLRASLICPKTLKRNVIRDNMRIVPSLAAMNWLRLTREALLHTS